jgi:hypothetical protein
MSRCRKGREAQPSSHLPVVDTKKKRCSYLVLALLLEAVFPVTRFVADRCHFGSIFGRPDKPKSQQGGANTVFFSAFLLLFPQKKHMLPPGQIRQSTRPWQLVCTHLAQSPSRPLDCKNEVSANSASLQGAGVWLLVRGIKTPGQSRAGKSFTKQ